MPNPTDLEKKLKVDLRALPDMTAAFVGNTAMITLQFVIDDLTSEMHSTSDVNEKILLSNLVARYLQVRMQLQERSRA